MEAYEIMLDASVGIPSQAALAARLNVSPREVGNVFDFCHEVQLTARQDLGERVTREMVRAALRGTPITDVCGLVYKVTRVLFVPAEIVSFHSAFEQRLIEVQQEREQEQEQEQHLCFTT